MKVLLCILECESLLIISVRYLRIDLQGLTLRLHHLHGFGQNEGGHFYEDTTPEEVEYLAYFSPAKVVYRVDRPADFSGFGLT